MAGLSSPLASIYRESPRVEIRNIRLVEPTQNGARTRLQAEITSRSDGLETCWFEVGASYPGELSLSGNPWLAAFLPIAATVGEPLTIEHPVDPLLLDNARRLLAIWKEWYPRLHDVSIECDVREGRIPRRDRTAALFGGGVDSFFTLLSREAGNLVDQAGRIDDLLTVCGFDVPLSQADDCARIRGTRRAIAESFGKRNIDIWTNLRDTQFQQAPWGELSHGGALAAVGLMFERHYDSILIPSTHRTDHVVPWGSHPLTDRLFSTRDVQIIHDGGSYGRVEKTEHIVKWDLPLETLRVCAYSRSADNCSECVKCFRTMATLELLGVLSRARTFEADKFSIEKLAMVYCSDDNERSFLREIQAQASRRGRPDIAQAIEGAFGQSARGRKWVALATAMRGLPLFWRLGEELERWVMGSYIS
jgi:hypothetical protein